MIPSNPPVVLASTSPYRRALLTRLLTEFTCQAPGVTEQRLPREAPPSLAVRLARLKAEQIARPGRIVIGGDQVAALGDRILAKPGSFEPALAQLEACSGRHVVFYTAVCVLGPAPEDRHEYLDETTVHFRSLSQAEIRRYLEREQPFDCAGSFKAEGLGVALFERIENQDPTAIQGLPLIWLAGCLRRLGVALP